MTSSRSARRALGDGARSVGMPAHASFDDRVEWLGRWTAGRTTRRSFLHRLGQLAVVVAAGPAIATILMKRAEARVCGQSGVTPKCATFACEGEGHVWGWCWYASDGCCRNDGLKKICDCCIVNYPNVHGYCPAGTNVACIVESCGEDPRLLPVDIVPIVWEQGSGYGSAAIAAAQGARSTRAVVADTSDPWTPIIAAPLAGALGVPLIEADVAGIAMAQLQHLDDLGVGVAMAVGPITAAANTALTQLGIRVEIVSNTGDRTQRCVDVANRIRTINDINRSVTVDPGAANDGGLAIQSATLAANFASLAGFPIAVGDAASAGIGMPTLAIGSRPLDGPAGSQRTASTTLDGLALELAELAAVTPFVDGTRVTLVPEGTSDLIGLTNLRSAIVFHPLGSLGDRATWLQNQGLRNGKWTTVHLVDGPGRLSAEEYWRLQGTVNGFRVDDLQGVSGQGLPVKRQPWAERPIGMARVDGALPWGSEPQPSYWTGVAQTFRG